MDIFSEPLNSELAELPKAKDAKARRQNFGTEHSFVMHCFVFVDGGLIIIYYDMCMLNKLMIFSWCLVTCTLMFGELT